MDAGQGTPMFSRRSLIAGAAGIAVMPAIAGSAGAATANPAWRLLPGEGPTGRWDHTLGADDKTKRLILFGGRDASGSPFGDTWLYDLAAREWRAVEAPGPAPRFGHAIALDQKRRRMILFGGQSADIFFNDTWLFDFESESWSQVEVAAGPLPAPRYGLGTVLDSQGRMIVSHGFTFEGRFDDTWALDLDQMEWTEISPDPGAARPLKRCLHEMIWHPKSETLLLYGGCSSGFGPCPQGDLWQFDPGDRAWREITPGEGPAPRSNPALVYDDDADRALLVAGLSDAGYVNDNWQGGFADAGFAWEPLPAGGDAPSPRASHDSVVTRGDLYLFGGSGDAGVTADLWKLSLS